MRQAQTREQLGAVVRSWRRSGRSIALVPTMGNLHEGHLALVTAARGAADRVVTSIYVNPTQFGAGEDFERYPRTLDEDQRQLEAVGCDLVFSPSTQTMYPCGTDDSTRVTAAPSLAGILEGECRPGHLDGVVTIVSRLFNMAAPDFAVFGEKDYQQLLVIRRLVADLGYPLHIVAVPTVRGDDGLALSSRNRYLGAEERSAAIQLNAVLTDAARRAAARAECLQTVEEEARAQLEQAGMRVDYVAVRRASDLASPGEADAELRVLAAVWCGSTRLIDNQPCCRL